MKAKGVVLIAVLISIGIIATLLTFSTSQTVLELVSSKDRIGRSSFGSASSGGLLLGLQLMSEVQNTYRSTDSLTTLQNTADGLTCNKSLPNNLTIRIYLLSFACGQALPSNLSLRSQSAGIPFVIVAQQNGITSSLRGALYKETFNVNPASFAVSSSGTITINNQIIDGPAYSNSHFEINGNALISSLQSRGNQVQIAGTLLSENRLSPTPLNPCFGGICPRFITADYNAPSINFANSTISTLATNQNNYSSTTYVLNIGTTTTLCRGTSCRNITLSGDIYMFSVGAFTINATTPLPNNVRLMIGSDTSITLNNPVTYQTPPCTTLASRNGTRIVSATCPGSSTLLSLRAGGSSGDINFPSGTTHAIAWANDQISFGSGATLIGSLRATRLGLPQNFTFDPRYQSDLAPGWGNTSYTQTLLTLED